MARQKNELIKIVFITSSLQAGGAQGNLISLSKYLSTKNYLIDIVLLKEKNDYSHQNLSKSTRIIPLIKSSDTSIPKLLLRIRQIFKNNNYSLVIGAHEYYPFYITALVSKLYGIKNIMLIGNDLIKDPSYKYKNFGWLHSLFIKTTFSFTDMFVFSCNGLASNAIKKYKLKPSTVKVVYNGLDIDRPKTSTFKNSAPNPKDGQIVCTVGRLIKKKGYHHLIKSFSLVKKTHPNTKLIIIGAGDLEKELKKLTIDLNLSKSVQFMGFVKDNPFKYLRKSKLFLFTSLYEGFGNTIIEAMSYGIPVVSTDCTYGPREILDDSTSYSHKLKKPLFAKYGILVPSFPLNKERSKDILGEEELLATTITQLLDNEKLLNRYKKLSLKRSLYFNEGRMGKSFEQAVNSLFK